VAAGIYLAPKADIQFALVAPGLSLLLEPGDLLLHLLELLLQLHHAVVQALSSRLLLTLFARWYSCRLRSSATENQCSGTQGSNANNQQHGDRALELGE
jgi:hypothetical protein